MDDLTKKNLRRARQRRFVQKQNEIKTILEKIKTYEIINEDPDDLEADITQIREFAKTALELLHQLSPGESVDDNL